MQDSDRITSLEKQHDNFMLQSFYPLQKKVKEMRKEIEDFIDEVAADVGTLQTKVEVQELARKVQIRMNGKFLIADNYMPVIKSEIERQIKGVKKVQKKSWWFIDLIKGNGNNKRNNEFIQ